MSIAVTAGPSKPELFGASPAEMGRKVLPPTKARGYERKRTDSRWNVLTAMKMATAAYTQVDAKITAMEFQW